MLREEYSLAQNVKDKTVRKNVMSALDKIIQHLKLFRQTPENGLIIFCGNISVKLGTADIKLWSLEPPEKLAAKIYRCDQVFVLDPLKHMVREREVYGLIVLDAREADIGLLKGKAVQALKHLESTVPSKTVKGGMCVAPDTFIQLADGKVIKIKNFSPNKNPFVSFDFDSQELVNANCNDIMTRNVKEAYKITTKAPVLNIIVSKDHKFFVPTSKGVDVKYTDELKVNDNLFTIRKVDIEGEIPDVDIKVPTKYRVNKNGTKFLIERRGELKLTQRELAKKIGISRRTYSSIERGRYNLKPEVLRRLLEILQMDESEFFKKFVKEIKLVRFPRVITRDLCQILGYMLGDGSKDYGRITLYDKDLELLLHYQKKIIRLFNLNTKINPRKEKGHSELRIYSQHLLRTIERHFPGVLEKRRKIDEIFHVLPSSHLGKFIRGLFDAEGSIDKNSKAITIGMSDEDVIRVLQLLLLRFGVVSSYMKEVYKGWKKHKLKIMDEDSLMNFSKHIGFSSKKKREDLKTILLKKKRSRKMIHVPVSGKFVLKLAKELRMNTESFPRVHNFFYDKEKKTFWKFEREILKYFKERVRKVKNANHKNLLEFRKALKMSQRGVAKLVDYSEYIIGKIERGEKHNKKVLNEIKVTLEKVRNDIIERGKIIIDFLQNMIDGKIILATINKIEHLNFDDVFHDLSVPVYGNFVANGIIIHNSQSRYDRLREEAIHEFLRKVGEAASNLFLPLELKGVLIGGPGFIKHRIMEKDYLNYQIKQRFLGTKDTSYTGEYGLQELVKRSEDLMEKASIVRERELLERFFTELQKEGNVVYGFKEVRKALDSGAVDMLIISEGFDWVHVKLKCKCGVVEKDLPKEKIEDQTCEKCGKDLVVEEVKELVDILVESAENVGTKIKFVSTDTREGAQFKELGGIGAFLRFKLN